MISMGSDQHALCEHVNVRQRNVFVLVCVEFVLVCVVCVLVRVRVCVCSRGMRSTSFTAIYPQGRATPPSEKERAWAMHTIGGSPTSEKVPPSRPLSA